MKISKLLCLIIFLSGCQSNEIILQAYEGEFDCHICPGYLIVKKQNLSDTIMTGSWGKVQGDYSVNKIMDQDYVVINSTYFGGGWIERSLNIYSTEEESFLDRVFSKHFIEKEEKYTEIENGVYRLEVINRLYEFIFRENTLVVDMDSTLSYSIEPSMDLIQISDGSTQEIIQIFQ